MKIQYTAVIFILIAIPILLVASYYMGLQIDSITLQTTYNTKLLASTKAAIEAFEINTVEWNNKYSDVANARRRNVEASINNFTQSLANNLGVSGANKEYIEAYIPAVLYTLYDGYYIYTPTDMKETEKDEKGKDVLTADGKIVYKAKQNGKTIKVEDDEGVEKEYNSVTTNADDAKETTEHTLLPFVSYSEQIGKMTISYTLDNYVKICGNFKTRVDSKNYGGDKTKVLSQRFSDGECYVKEEGHLLHNEYDIVDNNGYGKKLTEIKYKKDDGSLEIPIVPEELTENVKYFDETTNKYITKKFNYIYIEDSQGDKSKLYYSENTDLPDGITNNWFTLNSKDEQVFLSDNVTNVTQCVYKKVSLPGIIHNAGAEGAVDIYGVSTSNRYINFYQVLNRR